jgi:hypothetical protein
MDEFTINDLRDLAKGQTERADEYCRARRAAGEAKVALDLLLTAALPGIRAEKRNVGMDMAYLMLIERQEAARGYFEDWQKNEAAYKGLERLLDAYASRIMMELSILKRQADGERYGA